MPTGADGLATHVETWSEGLHCTLLLVDSTRRMLQPAATPSLPLSYIDAIGRVPIAVGQGSCGTAAARREMVFVDDVERSDLWATYAPIALSHGLRACWSTRIFDSAGGLLGTLALYYRERRTPTAATELPYCGDVTSCPTTWACHRDARAREPPSKRYGARFLLGSSAGST
jgi:GAF domain-containing protein